MTQDAVAQIEALFHLLLVPGRWLMAHVGLHPIDMQVWALNVAVFMLVLGGISTYGDLVLARRQVRTQGTVVSIDRNDVDTPRIGFTDQRGERYEFDSNLPIRLGADAVGDSIAVVYDPSNPKRVREAGRPIAKGFSIVVWYGVALAILAYAIVGGALTT
jgi:hypothetical protein